VKNIVAHDLAAEFSTCVGRAPVTKVKCAKVNLVRSIVFLRTGAVIPKETRVLSLEEARTRVPPLFQGAHLSIAGKLYSDLVELGQEYPGVGVGAASGQQQWFRGSTKYPNLGLLVHVMQHLVSCQQYWIAGPQNSPKKFGQFLVGGARHWCGHHDAAQCRRNDLCRTTQGGHLTEGDPCIPALRAILVNISKQYSDVAMNENVSYPEASFSTMHPKNDPYAKPYNVLLEVVGDDWFM